MEKAKHTIVRSEKKFFAESIPEIAGYLRSIKGNYKLVPDCCLNGIATLVAYAEGMNFGLSREEKQDSAARGANETISRIPNGIIEKIPDGKCSMELYDQVKKMFLEAFEYHEEMIYRELLVCISNL